MTAAEQPSLDLGDYRGRGIARTHVRLANANDGFHPSTDLDEPRVFELEEEFTVAIRIKVTEHHPKLIDKLRQGEEEDLLGMIDLGQTFKCGTIAIIPDTGKVKTELDRVEQRRKAAEAAATKAKESAKKAAAPKRSARGKGADVVPISDSLQEASDKGGFTV